MAKKNERRHIPDPLPIIFCSHAPAMDCLTADAWLTVAHWVADGLLDVVPNEGRWRTLLDIGPDAAMIQTRAFQNFMNYYSCPWNEDRIAATWILLCWSTVVRPAIRQLLSLAQVGRAWRDDILAPAWGRIAITYNTWLRRLAGQTRMYDSVVIQLQALGIPMEAYVQGDAICHDAFSPAFYRLALVQVMRPNALGHKPALEASLFKPLAAERQRHYQRLRDTNAKQRVLRSRKRPRLDPDED